MKRIFLFLICGVLVFGANGCANVLSSMNMVEREGTRYQDVDFTVASNPQGAAVYFNDQLMGHTPVTVKLHIPYLCALSSGAFILYDCTPKQQYVLKVTKSGFKDAVETIVFDRELTYNMGDTIYIPKKQEYSFTLTDDRSNSSAEEISKAEEIGRYKELMDKGAITKDEFEQKKKQLLGI